MNKVKKIKIESYFCFLYLLQSHITFLHSFHGFVLFLIYIFVGFGDIYGVQKKFFRNRRETGKQCSSTHVALTKQHLPLATILKVVK